MLTTARSNTIGILAFSSSSLFGPASSIDAVEAAARDAGYFVAIAHIASLDVDEIEAALDHLTAQAVEGIVVVAPQERVRETMRQVAITVPSVTLHGAEGAGGAGGNGGDGGDGGNGGDGGGGGDDGVYVDQVDGDGDGDGDGVYVDQVEGARMAVGHLAELGHRVIAHLAGPGDWAEANARRDGFLAETAAAGIRGIVSAPGDWTSASGAHIGADLLEDRSITAVFSSNDQMALGVLHAVRLTGRDAPGDVSVVGFDDIPEAAYFAPPLTTVRQDFAELGRTCVARLLAAIEHRPVPADPVIHPQLIVRASTAPPATRR
jgi:DNA-binding LacI/PurR family transcriptional regulator